MPLSFSFSTIWLIYGLVHCEAKNQLIWTPQFLIVIFFLRRAGFSEFSIKILNGRDIHFEFSNNFKTTDRLDWFKISNKQFKLMRLMLKMPKYLIIQHKCYCSQTHAYLGLKASRILYSLPSTLKPLTEA